MYLVFKLLTVHNKRLHQQWLDTVFINMSKKVAFVLFKVENYSQQLLEVQRYTEPLWFTDQCKFGKAEKTQMVEDMFLFIDFEQAVLQVSKTDTILFLGTEAAFPSSGNIYYFHYKEHQHFCSKLHEH